jgi:hypothetical protein
MEKNSRVEIGSTPSPSTGKPAQVIKEGEGVRFDDEQLPTELEIAKLSSVSFGKE